MQAFFKPMAISRKEKEEVVKKLVDKFNAAEAVVFMNYTGMTVADFRQLRKELRKTKGAVVIAKNTLVKRALDQSDRKGLKLEQFKGAMALAFSGDDVVAPARLVYKLAKEQKKNRIMKGILEDKLIEKTAVVSLAQLPTKPEMLGRLVGTIQAPISGFVNVLVGNLRGLIQVLSAIKDAKGA